MLYPSLLQGPMQQQQQQQQLPPNEQQQVNNAMLQQLQAGLDEEHMAEQNGGKGFSAETVPS